MCKRWRGCRRSAEETHIFLQGLSWDGKTSWRPGGFR
ncbi:rCG55369 [Rattus norvegicus]|uniref:RCG55369 n=1 Tax=Rattus norvegicus TaxID=10116 RepID=A6JRE0_RAT|nr:rCG55369 [Rattus norvegicus]